MILWDSGSPHPWLSKKGQRGKMLNTPFDFSGCVELGIYIISKEGNEDISQVISVGQLCEETGLGVTLHGTRRELCWVTDRRGSPSSATLCGSQPCPGLSINLSAAFSANASSTRFQLALCSAAECRGCAEEAACLWEPRLGLWKNWLAFKSRPPPDRQESEE